MIHICKNCGEIMCYDPYFNADICSCCGKMNRRTKKEVGVRAGCGFQPDTPIVIYKKVRFFRRVIDGKKICYGRRIGGKAYEEK